ncbi:MAG: aminodeoxychorismate synthase component I, partial [Acidimicrobiia bacterium]
MSGDVILAGSRWEIGPSAFNNPSQVLVADSVGAVEECVRAAEAAAKAGSWVVGFVSYDAAPGFDPKLEVPVGESGPLVWFGVYDAPMPWTPDASPRSLVSDWEPSMTSEEHSSKVEAIKQAIERGDTYQVNLTMSMTSTLAGTAAGLLAQMVGSQPKSYAALIDLDDTQVVSISPELFVSVDAGVVTMRPMKGTSPRGTSIFDDDDQRAELEWSEKERAGNVMIVDMLRNDLGRVSRTGSVSVPVLFRPERYPTVWQLTSTVQGELEGGSGLFELFRATFPSGSVTGAPKVSTMRIISGLEPTPRGVYCGAIGYIRPGGDTYEFSVAIRTGLVRGRQLSYHVGGGITFDSDAAVEYEECLWKALVVTAENVTPDLIETMRYEPGDGITLIDRHMQRLFDSARYWDIKFDPVAVGDALSAVESTSRPIKVRLILHRNGDVEVEMEEIAEFDEPVALTLATTRIDPSEPHWYHKTLDRSRYPDPEEGEVVLVNLEGHVTETNISNLMVRLGDRWVTPVLESGCLPGVYREMLLDDEEVEEDVVTIEDLKGADEIAVTNAVRGWRKAVLA